MCRYRRIAIRMKHGTGYWSDMALSCPLRLCCFHVKLSPHCRNSVGSATAECLCWLLTRDTHARKIFLFRKALLPLSSMLQIAFRRWLILMLLASIFKHLEERPSCRTSISLVSASAAFFRDDKVMNFQRQRRHIKRSRKRSDRMICLHV